MASVRGRLAFAVAALLASPALADESPAVNATQLAGLFMQSCIAFIGDQAGLRGWAKSTGLSEVPSEGARIFLSGRPGVVYDATNQQGKFVLIAADAGGCSAVAQYATGADVVRNLEQDMRDMQIDFKLATDQDDAQERSLHQREYSATKGRLAWRIVVSTVRDSPGQAMLTALPR